MSKECKLLPTFQESRTARKLLRQNIPMASVMVRLGSFYNAQEINDGIENLRRHARDMAKRDVVPLRASQIETRSDVQIPDDRIAERDHRRSLFPISITARMMGDPLPGYSALDREPSLAPSMIHDPLDDLMYRRTKVGARYG